MSIRTLHQAIAAELDQAGFKVGRAVPCAPPPATNASAPGLRVSAVNMAWHPCFLSPPDSDRSVLVYDPGSASESVWPGYFFRGGWFYADHTSVNQPTLWTEMPKPPL